MEAKKLILSILTTCSETKIAVYSRKNQLFSETVVHDSKALEQFDAPIKQLDIRCSDITWSLTKSNINLSQLGAVVTKGGTLKEIDSGLYYINQKLSDDASKNLNCNDFVNLGILIIS
jgi:butyrate kinase